MTNVATKTKSNMARVELSGAPITALMYDDGPEFDSRLWSAIARFRSIGLRLAGIAQINEARSDRRRCDMIVEDLYSGARALISKDRGNLARGCRLDHDVLCAVMLAVERSLTGNIDLLIINKFGKEEAEGRGFRHVIGLALELEIPVLIGVPTRNQQSWRQFSGDAERV